MAAAGLLIGAGSLAGNSTIRGGSALSRDVLGAWTMSSATPTPGNCLRISEGGNPVGCRILAYTSQPYRYSSAPTVERIQCTFDAADVTDADDDTLVLEFQVTADDGDLSSPTALGQLTLVDVAPADTTLITIGSDIDTVLSSASGFIQVEVISDSDDDDDSTWDVSCLAVLEGVS